MRLIKGGYSGDPASCTASCNSGPSNSVTCHGTSCVANDNVGCTSQSEDKTCAKG